MANVPESPAWEPGIYQFETSDPVQGGPDGIDNLPSKQLANRTAFLRGLINAVITQAEIQPSDTDLTQFYEALRALGLRPATDEAAGVVKLADITSTLVAHLRGIPFPFPGEVPPPGAIAYDGAELLRDDFPELWAWAQTYATIVTDAEWHADMWGAFSSGDGATTFRVPDLRGEHIRGWDAGRGVDPGRMLGSWQEDEIKSHTHATRRDQVFQSGSNRTGAYHDSGSFGQGYIQATGGPENRVRTLAYNYCAFY